MCDYSLMGVPSRLAKEGEELVVHLFPTRSKGLASQDEIVAEQSRRDSLSMWARVKEFFEPLKLHSVTAVCIPPGARLRMLDIPACFRSSLKISETEDVTFTQMTAAANAYRDAVRFGSGHELLLQALMEGQRVKILNLDAESESNVYRPEGIAFSS